MISNLHTLSFRVLAVLLFCVWYMPSPGQSVSSPTENKEIVIKYFDEVINSKKLNRLNDFFSADYLWHQMDGKDTRSSQDSSHLATLRWLFTAIPDVHYTIDQVLAEGVMVSVSTTATGTAKCEMFGLPAARKMVAFKQVFLFRFANKKMTDEWEVVDLASLNAQLAKQ